MNGKNIVLTNMMALAILIEPQKMLPVINEVCCLEQTDGNSKVITLGRITAEMIAINVVNRCAMSACRWNIGHKKIVLFTGER